MTQNTRSITVRLCLAMLAALLAGGTAHGQEAAPEQDAATALVRELMQRLENVESELARLKANGGQVPADKKDQKVLTLLETPYLGATYYGSANGSRFFAAKLIFINLTPRPVTVKREQIALDADGTAHPLAEIPQQLQHQSFQVGNQGYQLRNLQPAAEVQVASGGTGSTWVVFTGLPAGTEVPELTLKMTIGETKQELDVNEFCLGLLGLTIERIGPQGSLALLTISGTFNTINIGALTEALDRLTTQKIARAVIRWTDAAAPLESQLTGWLGQAAYQAGRSEVHNSRFPTVPLSLRELHLAGVPNGENTGYSPPAGAPRRIHKTDREAVAAALRSAYEVLPVDELLREIEHGHPLTRAAAIEGGGGRLPSDKLPLLLSLADDKDAAIQLAALTALRHFGEQEAIDALLRYARKNAGPTASAAIESLAASRFAAANRALLELLKNEPPASRKTIVGVLSRYPRPIWSETIYEFVKNPDSGLGVDGLRALALVGHPKMLEVFETALGSTNTALKDGAFNLLAGRTDSESEALAMQFTLKHLKNAPPTPQMNQLLFRTKDRRALPLLLDHFEKMPQNRQAIIGTLTSLGDESVAEVFVKSWPKLKNHEQAAVLNALVQLKSPDFRRLAGQALLSNDSSVVSAAAQGLQADGSDEAAQLLIDALETSNQTTTWSYVSNALATLGTSEARAALYKARESSDQNKRNYAENALRNMRQRSPGYQYIYQAQQFARQEKWNEAIAQYSVALEIDADLPEAYAGRANAYLKQKKYKEARGDFEKALKLDPHNSQVVTGKALLDVVEGDYEDGIKSVEDARERFPNDVLYAYNAACVYAQALDALNKDEKAVDKDKKQEQYRNQALADLKRSVKLGFQDFDWMKKDPDLKPLHGDADFKKVATPGAENAGAARPVGRRGRGVNFFRANAIIDAAPAERR